MLNVLAALIVLVSTGVLAPVEPEVDYCRICNNGYDQWGFESHNIGIPADGYWKWGMMDIEPHGDHFQPAWLWCTGAHYFCPMPEDVDFDLAAFAVAMDDDDVDRVLQMIDAFPSTLIVSEDTDAVSVRNCQGKYVLNLALSEGVAAAIDGTSGRFLTASD